jgi:hypothetical protein
MNALDIIKLLLSGDASLPALNLTDWTVSVNGMPKGPVGSGKLGLNGTTLWVDMAFSVDGATHVLHGERGLTGAPGSAVVTLDGTVLADGRLSLKKHILLFPPSLRIEIDLTGAQAARYRFDARVS